EGDERGERELPRLWWCPTSLLSFFPLHAAGKYAAGEHRPHGVADHVVSSYTATLSALRRSASKQARPAAERTLLVVAAPEVPGYPPLDHALEEAGRLAELFPEATVLAGDDATRDAVVGALPEHSWVHFACHATADPLRSSANHLVLVDGALDMADLAGLSLDAELAFLAACGTAAGSVRLADEAQHVASSFQLAGYAHVIATLWEVADGDAADVTTRLYGEMTGGGLRPARAVHRITRELRDRYPRSPWLWAPYTHIGA
ncbi:CHAT domain-containing protein, partial [Streptomyces sp. ISL-98]|uniref:CHAT domain-containing protein n=1 Tax=Streptomyces sp. ISL-98 TaxID=2819192 RepID=UPI001BE843F5